MAYGYSGTLSDLLLILREECSFISVLSDMNNNSRVPAPSLSLLCSMVKLLGFVCIVIASKGSNQACALAVSRTMSTARKKWPGNN